MDEEGNEGVPLLWTGGWDSTFQLLDLLLRQGVVVTPWYVIDAERRSTGVELDTMRRIREELARRFPEARTRLRPQRFRAVEDIAPEPSLSADWQRVAGKFRIGGQYDWLARLCRQEGLEGLQLSIHRDDRARAAVLAAREPTDPADEAAGRLFSPFEFPLLGPPRWRWARPRTGPAGAPSWSGPRSATPRLPEGDPAAAAIPAVSRWRRGWGIASRGGTAAWPSRIATSCVPCVEGPPPGFGGWGARIFADRFWGTRRGWRSSMGGGRAEADHLVLLP
ncbi:MAG: hypothetical protein ACLFTX_03215 [Thiohalospira sp.]